MTSDPATIDHLAHLRHDGQRLAEVVARGPLDAPVAACPGWDLRQLGIHIGQIHRWVVAALDQGRPPTDYGGDGPPDDGPGLAEWIGSGHRELVERLSALGPDAPVWHPFPAPPVASTWWRRQAQETMLHRWDAERAIGLAPSLDPVLASDGIDEYLGTMLPRHLQRSGAALPSSSLHVHCTDTPGEWLVRSENGALVMTREHAKGDAALRGPAAALELRLWGRESPGDDAEIIGDPAAADAWLALGGL